MSGWIQEFDGIFWMSLATILVGAFGVSVKYCLKSKCEHLTLCCGLLKIDRRVDLEVQSELRQMEMGIEEKDDFAMPESKMAMPSDVSRQPLASDVSRQPLAESKLSLPSKQPLPAKK